MRTQFERLVKRAGLTPWPRLFHAMRASRETELARERVRMYFRRDHYVLQWWDSQSKRTLSDRVNGDLVAAIARAREIEDLIDQSKAIGGGVRKLKHRDLVERFNLDLSRRADAGEIAPATARRYRSSLAHYQTFTDQPHISKAFRFAGSVNREFQLEFSSYLSRLEVAPNGHLNAGRHVLQNQRFVLDAVRAMYAWAADPDGGKLLPENFRNPFRRRHGERNQIANDLFGEPDVTIAMAGDFMRACDSFQLQLLSVEPEAAAGFDRMPNGARDDGCARAGCHCPHGDHRRSP